MDPSAASPSAEPPAVPRWVILLAAGAVAVLVVFVALHLTGAAPTGH